MSRSSWLKIFIVSAVILYQTPVSYQPLQLGKAPYGSLRLLSRSVTVTPQLAAAVATAASFCWNTKRIVTFYLTTFLNKNIWQTFSTNTYLTFVQISFVKNVHSFCWIFICAFLYQTPVSYQPLQFGKAPNSSLRLLSRSAAVTGASSCHYDIKSIITFYIITFLTEKIQHPLSTDKYLTFVQIFLAKNIYSLPCLNQYYYTRVPASGQPLHYGKTLTGRRERQWCDSLNKV